MKPIKELLQFVIGRNGTDLHLKVGTAPMARIAGNLEAVGGEEVLKAEETKSLLHEILSKDQLAAFEEHLEIDFSHPFSDEYRFRVNAYYHMGTVAFAFRLLRRDMLSFEGLFLPDVVMELANRHRGLILVTGITGSGKSTTMATMVDYINRSKQLLESGVKTPNTYAPACERLRPSFLNSLLIRV